jgi:hypothetical protein
MRKVLQVLIPVVLFSGGVLSAAVWLSTRENAIQRHRRLFSEATTITFDYRGTPLAVTNPERIRKLRNALGNARVVERACSYPNPAALEVLILQTQEGDLSVRSGICHDWEHFFVDSVKYESMAMKLLMSELRKEAESHRCLVMQQSHAKAFRNIMSVTYFGVAGMYQPHPELLISDPETLVQVRNALGEARVVGYGSPVAPCDEFFKLKLPDGSQVHVSMVSSKGAIVYEADNVHYSCHSMDALLEEWRKKVQGASGDKH